MLMIFDSNEIPDSSHPYTVLHKSAFVLLMPFTVSTPDHPQQTVVGAYHDVLPYDLQQLFVKYIALYSTRRTHEFIRENVRKI